MDLVIINTFEGSQKHKNAIRKQRVALDVVDPSNPFSLDVIRGRVKEVTFKRVDEHVDRLAKKYMGVDSYQRRLPQKRVLIKIEPTHIVPPWSDDSRWKKLDKNQKRNQIVTTRRGRNRNPPDLSREQ